MAKQLVNIGSAPNDGTGDPLRQAMDKINDNVNEIYSAVGDGTDLTTLINAAGEIEALGEANKISFWYENYADLPNAVLNQGALAYVENNAAVYYSLGSQGWRKLLSDNSNNDIIGYTDSLPTYPNVGGGGGGGTSNTFSTFAISGQDPIIADTVTDTITFAAGNNITLTANAATDTITIAAAGGGGGNANNAFGTVRVSGQTDVVADTTGDILNVANGAGIEISTNAATDTLIITATGGGGGGIPTRMERNVTAANIAAGTTSYQVINGFKGYALLKIQVSQAAWVRLYTDIASRTADASRTQLQDPAPDSGVIAEVITAGNETVVLSPGVFGFSNESTPSTNIPLAITNNTGGLASITVTLTLIQLES
jgi:hypothetical protein